MRSTALISAAQSAGFPNPGYSCVPVMVELTTATASRASGPPERGLFEYPYKVENGLLTIQAGAVADARDRDRKSLTGEKPPCAS